MPSFSKCEDCHSHVLTWTYVLIIWLISVFVGCTVNQPCDIQDEGVSKHGSNEPGICPGLTPAVDRNDCWKNEADEWHENQVVLLLEM